MSSRLPNTSARSAPENLAILLREPFRAGTELQALAFSTAASQAYRAQFKRDGRSVRDLLTQRDAPFQDYRTRAGE